MTRLDEIKGYVGCDRLSFTDANYLISELEKAESALVTAKDNFRREEGEHTQTLVVLSTLRDEVKELEIEINGLRLHGRDMANILNAFLEPNKAPTQDKPCLPDTEYVRIKVVAATNVDSVKITKDKPERCYDCGKKLSKKDVSTFVSDYPFKTCTTCRRGKQDKPCPECENTGEIYYSGSDTPSPCPKCNPKEGS